MGFRKHLYHSSFIRYYQGGSVQQPSSARSIRLGTYNLCIGLCIPSSVGYQSSRRHQPISLLLYSVDITSLWHLPSKAEQVKTKMTTPGSTNGGHSTEGLSILLRRLRETKRSWEAAGHVVRREWIEIVEEFQALTGITEIDFVGENLGNTIISALGRAMVGVPFPILKSLQLGGNYVTEEGIAEVARAIEMGHMPALESLGLFPERTANDRRRFLKPKETAWVRNQIKDEGVAILASAFASGHASQLKVLTLELNGLSTEGARVLSHEIRAGKLPALEVLNLSYNDLGDEGVRLLAEAFVEAGNKLKVLDLETCNIFVDGAKALASAFMSGYFPRLTELYMGNNDMGRTGPRDGLRTPSDAGLLELARVLLEGQLPKLQILDLEHNVGGSKKAAEAFRNAVRSNRSLDLTLKINWPSFGTYDASVRRCLERNRGFARMLEQLQGEDDVPATSGKIFLCGDPMTGKTTLRRSLQKKYNPMFGWAVNERGLVVEPRTRGIEVSQVVCKGERRGEAIKLAIWDLAGQWEYQILHSAFLPDLAFADGQATTFVVVCNAQYCSEDTGREDHGRQTLNYWMRFIASSARKGEEKGKRHVVLVLNCFNDQPCAYLDQWVKYVRELQHIFSDYLVIEDSPFVVDARLARSVLPLKKHLLRHTEKKLDTKRVPKVCQFIQDTLKDIVTTRDFPVVPWTVFAGKFENSVSDKSKLEAAVDYLHESGDLILFREGWEYSVHEGFGPGRSLVVLDPDWFCRRVVGHLLVPDDSTMLAAGERPLARRVNPDGSVRLAELKRYFDDRLRDAQQVNDIVAMLLRLGICYFMPGKDEVLFPALISDSGNEHSNGFWSDMQEAGDQWVMGYCLKVQDRTTSLLPIAVFRRLQVDLAKDPMCACSDSGYTAGKFTITFRVTGGMAVLVELNARDPNLEDRLDILVRPLVRGEFDWDYSTRRGRQVELAQMILERFVGLAEIWSPGVEFVRLVIKPWRAAKGTVPMANRDVALSVDGVTSRVQAGETRTAWTVGGEPVNLLDLLSGKELKGLKTLVEEKCALAETLMVDLLFLPEEVDPPAYPGDVPFESPESETSGTDPLVENLVRMKIATWFRILDEKLDRLLRYMVLVRKDLGEVLGRQRKLLKKLQALDRFSRDEVRNSVPRFMYLTKPRDASGMWMTLRDKFVQNATLHFLCEAHYNDHSLHEIEDQEGIEITNLSKVAAKIVPWLTWSLKVAFVVGKVATQALLPGLAQLIPTFPGGEDGAHDWSVSTSIAYWINAAFITGAEVGLVDNPTDISGLQNSSTSIRPVEVKGGLKDVLSNLIGKELKPMEFQSKFKLNRAVLNDSGDVVWICNDCFTKFYTEGAVEPL